MSYFPLSLVFPMPINILETDTPPVSFPTTEPLLERAFIVTDRLK